MRERKAYTYTMHVLWVISVRNRVRWIAHKRKHKRDTELGGKESFLYFTFISWSYSWEKDLLYIAKEAG
jgi:hypothetical protein